MASLDELEETTAITMTISSYNTITIDSVALEKNYRLIRQHVPHTSRLMAMIKSDGYGHGMITCAEAFARAGCEHFGVAEIGEGVDLREAGCSGTILTFLGFDHRLSDYFFSHHLTPVIYDLDDLLTIAAAAEHRHTRIPIYLKFDCGMSRLGFYPSEFSGLVSRLQAMEHVVLAGLMSHFPCTDDRSSDNTAKVYQVFNQTTGTLNKESLSVRSIGNSGSALYFPQTHDDMVRVGIALYGYYPDGRKGRLAADGELLEPAMSYSTRVLQVRDIAAGTGVSYGHTFIAETDMRLAVLPIGYSDGYPRTLSNRAEVLIRGKRARLRGRVCMNLCMVDITDIDGVESGDEVIVLGTQGQETIDADELGAWCNTISYEVLCSLGNNNQRETR
jgi:alanine racemase